jgi:hypothetical protein
MVPPSVAPRPGAVADAYRKVETISPPSSSAARPAEAGLEPLALSEPKDQIQFSQEARRRGQEWVAAVELAEKEREARAKQALAGSSEGYLQLELPLESAPAVSVSRDGSMGMLPPALSPTLSPTPSAPLSAMSLASPSAPLGLALTLGASLEASSVASEQLRRIPSKRPPSVLERIVEAPWAPGALAAE